MPERRIPAEIGNPAENRRVLGLKSFVSVQESAVFRRFSESQAPIF
jgi:hypothetical protein